jgi:macrolide transport system ATP-binding/permease protein
VNGGWFGTIYRAGLRFTPEDFRRRFGDEAMDVALARMSGRPPWKRPAAAIHELVDLVSTIRRERRAERTHEEGVRAWQRYLRDLGRDMRYAVRALRKSPGFALVGVMSMGIGMGLTTWVYHAKWEVIFRDLPSAGNADRLVMAEKPVSYSDIERDRNEQRLFAGVAALETGIPFTVTFPEPVHGRPERVFGQLVSADYFSVLGVRAQRGRVLSADRDKPGDAAVVVISDRFWRTRLDAAPDVVGYVLHLNGQPATVVGITPKDFNGALAINPAELFVPITAPAAIAPELAGDVLHDPRARDFFALMCLSPGVRLDSAETALAAITRRRNEPDSRAPAGTDASSRITLLSAGSMVPLPRNLRAVLAGFLVALMGLILTIACMNLGNMLLARGANRRRELAIRLAVGASRSRLVRQMVSEGLVLAFFGALAAFVLASLISVLGAHFTPPSAVPTEPPSMPGWRATVFLFVVAIGCGVGFSLAPALRATKADVTQMLKDGPVPLLPGHRRFGLRNVQMVAQVAGSLMLLLVTGFLVLGIGRMGAIPTTFDPQTMLLLSLDPVRDGYAPARAEPFFAELSDRLTAARAGRRVALAAQAPFSSEDDPVQVMAEDSRVEISAVEETVGAGYFGALGEPMLAGREFGGHDEGSDAGGSTRLPVVLNASAARGLFGARSPIGELVKDDRRSLEVVGVIRDFGVGLGESPSAIYLPLTPRNFTRPPADGLTLVVRTDEGPAAFNALRREIAIIDPHVTVFNVRTLSDSLALNRSHERFAFNTYGSIGLFGLLLAAVGLAGVTACTVAQRRKEIGIRVALGARRGQVLRLVLGEGLALVSVGTALGFLGAFALAKMLSALTAVFFTAAEVSTTDPRLLVGAPLLLAALAILACYLPARRAATTDPLQVLREG